MTAPWSPRPATDHDPVPPTASPMDAAAEVLDELVVLDQLEADLAAVEVAVERLERVATEGSGGEDAAAQIAAAVSVERFGPAVTAG